MRTKALDYLAGSACALLGMTLGLYVRATRQKEDPK